MGCTTCIKRCPTGAIRVRNGKAHIISERCTDCGECIRVCPHHAKYAERENLERLSEFKYNVAVPAPSLYGQFKNLSDVDCVLTALKRTGFDDVCEVAGGAERVSEATRLFMSSDETVRPVISSACPAVCRLIRVCFPTLIPHVIPLNSPMEETGRLAREKAKAETGLADEDIGVFFITPCPAKITAIKQPLYLPKSNISGAIAIKDIYPTLLKHIKSIGNEQPEHLKSSGILGIGWATSGGESSALLRDSYLAADGIENVIKILEEIENEKLNNIDFVELNACTGGCVGGSLTAENPFVAKARLQQLRRGLPVSLSHLEDGKMNDKMRWQKPLVGMDIMRLSDDRSEAMQMMAHMEEIRKRLPGLDCGTCGAPSCAALSEDVVRGFARETDCIFRLRDALEEPLLRDLLPAPFRRKE